MSRIVLLVDDDPLVLDITGAMLEELGCEVLTAGSGAQALARIAATRHIDTLITDINMPAMSGYELAERARRLRHGLAVIFLSGRETDGHGFPIVRKPFAGRDLARVMSGAGLC